MNENMRYLISVTCGVLMASVGILYDCGKDIGREEIRKEAIKAGVACYYCHPKTAQCSFLWGKNWKQCETEKK